MEKIKYYYSAMSKQVFILILGLLIIMRFILFLQVIKYDLLEYANNFNLWATVILYGFYLFICMFFFTAYKFFYATFDENQIIYYNKILRKKKIQSLNNIKKAHLSKKGVYLYSNSDSDPVFYLPFFRFGIISPVGIDKFYKILKQKDIEIQKDFSVLPGQGKKWKWVSIIYTCIALFTLASTTQTIALVSAIFKSH